MFEVGSAWVKDLSLLDEALRTLQGAQEHLGTEVDAEQPVAREAENKTYSDMRNAEKIGKNLELHMKVLSRC